MELKDLIALQLKLQQKHMKDGDPRYLTGDARADFIRWNMLATEDELHEALQETGWKPWASDRSLNREAYINELVDAFHFFMNLLLVASPGMDPEEIAADFEVKYLKKRGVNAQRQQEGYTGQKCPACHREVEMGIVVGVPLDGPVRVVCPCGNRFEVNN
jgi:dimeric dUTPase (all-alpha-NTP-PPase superfamily)